MISVVKDLGGVHTLDLSGCKRVHDVGALGNVHSLDLSGCYIIAGLAGTYTTITTDGWSGV